MSPKDFSLALIVIVVWGLNFVLIKIGLHGVPPMLLGALRFTLAAIPAVFFIKRPAVPWPWLLAYGLTISVGQFAFLFSAMAVGMPAGLASLVLQSQAFFTLFFAAWFIGERLKVSNLLGLLVAAGGLALIGAQAGKAMTLLGFVLTLGAAAMWSLGNIVTKKIGKVDMLGLVVWGSLIPPLPFLAMSLILEGPALIEHSLLNINLSSVLCVFYLAFGATLLGYGLWSRLLSRYPASTIAPLPMLVPIIGLSSAAWLVDEQLTGVQIAGALLVMAGLLINVFGGRLFRARTATAHSS